MATLSLDIENLNIKYKIEAKPITYKQSREYLDKFAEAQKTIIPLIKGTQDLDADDMLKSSKAGADFRMYRYELVASQIVSIKENGEQIEYSGIDDIPDHIILDELVDRLLPKAG